MAESLQLEAHHRVPLDRHRRDLPSVRDADRFILRIAQVI
jgi:hypothetical protein